MSGINISNGRNPAVWVIVLNWNGKQHTIECLDSLRAVDYQEFKILVVDNGSGDHSVEEIHARFPSIDVIKNGINLGYAEGNNAGLRYAISNGADFVLLLNNDTVVDKYLLRDLVETADRYPDAGIFSPAIFYCSDPAMIWYAGGRWLAKEQHFVHLDQGQTDLTATEPEDIDYASGCALFLRKAVVETVGLMDSRFYLTYEESDWCYRARAAGIRCLLVPHAKVWHKVAASFGGEGSPLQLYFHSRNILLWGERHLPRKQFYALLKKRIRSVFGLGLGGDLVAPFWKRWYWILLAALRRVRQDSATPEARAKYLGLRDYILRRFGDCPAEIRHLNNRQELGSGGRKRNRSNAYCVGFLPWWPQNPYQILLKRQLNLLGFRVIGNPPLSLWRVLLNRQGLDVVHIHWPHGLYMKNYWRLPVVVTILLLYRVFRNNVVWTVHELAFYETKLPVIDRLMIGLLMRICHTLFVHTRNSREVIARDYHCRGKIVITAHPAYGNFYANNFSRAAAREQLKLSLDGRVFLCFGYVKPYKGVEDLISAFRSLESEGSTLLIVGKPLDARTAEHIDGLASNDSRIRTELRYVDDEEIQVFMNAADIAVFPFRTTHTSGSIMLALTFGKPVVAPAIASVSEYLDASHAVLYDPSDKKGLSSALREVGERDLVTMTRAARQRAKRSTWTDMAAQHASVYREIIDDGGSWQLAPSRRE